VGKNRHAKPLYHTNVNWLWWYNAVKRQRDYSEESASYVDVYPITLTSFPDTNVLAFYTFRNTTLWIGAVQV